MRPGSPSTPERGRSCRKGGGLHVNPAREDRRSGYGARALGHASSSSGDSSLLGGHSVRPPEQGPTFRRIRWWDPLQEADCLPVLKEAMLCKPHWFAPDSKPHFPVLISPCSWGPPAREGGSGRDREEPGH